MDMREAMDSARATWSRDHVCAVARRFLAQCDWELETEEGLIRVPPDTELLVYSAAIIVSDFHGFRDHIEAIVYLGAEITPSGVAPTHGVLRLYLNAQGQMITEDRYSKEEWGRR